METNVSRRNFLKVGGGALLGALALSVVTQTPKPVHAAENFTGNPDRYGMLTDTTMCLGCRMCEAACHRANGLPEINFTDQTVFDAARKPDSSCWTVVNRYQTTPGQAPVYRKVQCMHCDEPACVSACLVGALKKSPEGPVVYNENLCIGCRYCMNACPYTMLAYSFNDPLTPAIRKCLMWYQRVTTQGKMPACAESCPAKATIFGKRSDLLNIANARILQNPQKYVNQVYGEKEAGGAGRLYLSAVPFTQLGLPGDLGSTAFPEFTRDWLLAVPLVIVLWPTLLMGIRHFSNRKDQLAVAEAASKKGESVK
jgi:Fe-S-cluster-containing dehydrogenase component